MSERPMRRISEIVDLPTRLDEIAKARATYRATQIAKFHLSPDVNCPTCGDSGYELVDASKPCGSCDPGRALGERQKAETAWDAECPRRFRGYRLESHPQRQEVRRARMWLEQRASLGQNLILLGGVGCVAGDTLIDGPDGARPISELASHGLPFRVWSLDGDQVVPAWSTGAFRKGVADLYQVTLDDGRRITATGNHRFLTPDGWHRLDQLGVGSLLGCDEFHSETTEAPVLAESLSGGTHSSGTPQGSQGGYSSDCRRCGERLPQDREISQDDLRSRGDALGRNCADRRTDGREHRSTHTHPYPRAGRLAIDDSGAQTERPDFEMGYQTAPSRSESLSDSLRNAGRLPADSNPTRTSSGSRPAAGLVASDQDLLGVGPRYQFDAENVRSFLCSHRSAMPMLHGSFLSHADDEVLPPASGWAEGLDLPFHTLSPDNFRTVVHCSYYTTAEYFDMHVPVHENYLAHGIWNHNTGKTGLGVALVREASLRGMTHRFGTAADILDAMRPRRDDAGKPDDMAAEYALRSLQTVDLLLLDDLGAEKQTDWAAERLYLVINGRYERELPTIVTSNLTIDQMTAMHPEMGARIVSRLLESYELIPLLGDDLRRMTA